MRNYHNEIDKLYSLYGYERIEQNDDYCVYRFKQGMYYAVDIIVIKECPEIYKTRDEYAKIGYATEVLEFSKINLIEERMFNGFFEVDTTSKRLDLKHSAYVKKQEEHLGGSYHYIPCPYKIVKGEGETNDENIPEGYEDGLIQKLSSAVNDDGAHLVLIEAAAGFGKTSTIYELLHNLLGNSYKKNPIFIELSKNRQAKIFKHVLLNEFESAYPHLKYELIVHEIQAGKIPLIIDGFDELLYSSTTTSGDPGGDYEDVQTMLETIGEVVRRQAKVILTTRRTAIFAGDEFFSWAIDNSDNFSTTRYLLEKPSITKWIGDDRYKKIIEQGIPITHIANPVLLSYIRNIEEEEFIKCCCNREKLVRSYFEKLLFREQNRQKLLIDAERQMELFTNLAKNFVEYNINSEEKDFIRDLICSESETLLKETLQKYLPNERPSLEDLAETLTNHALLDRKGSLEDQIGFINDFVYGYMLALSLCNNSRTWVQKHLLHEGNVELICNSFKVRNKIHRECIRKKIELVEEVMDPQTILMADLSLLGEIKQSFENKMFGSLEVGDGRFGNHGSFRNCTFNDCVFNDCTFDIEVFDDVTFVNCSFSNCDSIGNLSAANGARWFLASEDYGNGFIENFSKNASLCSDKPISVDYERKVLEQFWLPGKDKYYPRRRMRTLYKGFEISKRSPITEAIQSLIQKGWVSVENDTVTINKAYISEIIERLGRGND